jgi:hypothetical protein
MSANLLVITGLPIAFSSLPLISTARMSVQESTIGEALTNRVSHHNRRRLYEHEVVELSFRKSGVVGDIEITGLHLLVGICLQEVGYTGCHDVDVTGCSGDRLGVWARAVARAVRARALVG